MYKRKARFNVDTKDQQGRAGPQLRFNAMDQKGKGEWLLALASDPTIEKGEEEAAAEDEVEVEVEVEEGKEESGPVSGLLLGEVSLPGEHVLWIACCSCCLLGAGHPIHAQPRGIAVLVAC